jgi:hypothetical protein
VRPRTVSSLGTFPNVHGQPPAIRIDNVLPARPANSDLRCLTTRHPRTLEPRLGWLGVPCPLGRTR